ncbi:39506_t:CDS:2, partial [Gigaspora margarita]
SSTKATLSFITPRRPISSLSNLTVSPILQREGTSSFITYQFITTRLEPEDLNDPFSLPSYNEDTTVINFSPQRNSLPSSPLVDIPLRTPPRIPSPAPTTASFPNLLTRFINFITPGQRNNLPPPRLYSVHTEETNPIPPVIVDINPSNEEPIRTPTPEAPLVNQPGSVDEAPLPPPLP